MDTPGVIQIIILVILILLSAFFSSAETAFTTVTMVKMRSLADDGKKRALKVIKILEHQDKMLSTILIGNNIVNLSASAIATTLAIRINLAVGIMTGILTLVILIAGEIVPKTWAMYSAEKMALIYCDIIYGLMVVMTPVIFVVDKIAKFFLWIMRIDTSKKASITEDELRTYVEVSHEDGVIESEEKEMINNVFDFSDAEAKDIMIPRVNMITVNVNDDYDTVLKVFRESMYTRLPVWQDARDNIIGLINIKDFILISDEKDFKISNMMRKPHYTYEFAKLDDLMYEMRENTVNVSFVLNEYGTTEGMITLEDLLEEIVGDIRDEYDADELNRIQKMSDDTYLIEGSLNLDDLNDALGLEIESEDFDSVGGILIEHLGHIPAPGDSVTLENGVTLKAHEMDNHHIKKILLTLPPVEISENDEEEPIEEEER
ncbi:MAG: hemolysin family protein [Acetatifactor sp.]|nr:hemolysin family protein [Acetatifactor sp.]